MEIQYPQIKFYRTEIEKMLLLDKLRNDPVLKNIFKKNKDLTDMINRDIHQRMNGSINNFVTLFIIGEQGKWKSSTAINIATKHDSTKYAVGRIGFNYEDFKQKVSDSQPKQWFQLDEEIFKHGVGSRRILDEIQTLIETLRKRQNSMTIVTPEKKYFDENLFTYTLEMLDNRIVARCPINRRLHDPRTCECDFKNNYEVVYAESRALVKQSGQYIGFYRTEIEWNTQLWAEYNKIKDEFNELVLKSQTNATPYKKMAKEILKHPDLHLYKNSKQLKLFVGQIHPQLTIGESDLVVEAIKIERTKEKQGYTELNDEEEKA